MSDFNSAWANRIALLIIVGLFVDVGDALAFRAWPEWLIGIVANLLIVGGVWGELFFAERARSADDNRVAQAEKALAAAIDRAAKAELELANLKRPRMLDGAAFAAALSLPKGKARVLYVRESSDCLWLAAFITGGLQQAGWEILELAPLSAPPNTPAGLLDVVPLSMAFHAHPWGVSVIAKKIDSVFAVAEALKAGGLAQPNGTEDADLPDDEIRIVVAPRV